MKKTNQSQDTVRVSHDKHVRPENKDNLDSREGEEQLDKGNSSTHNKKETKAKRPANNKQPF